MADSIYLTTIDLIDRLLANLPIGYSTATVKQPNAPFTLPTSKWLECSVANGTTDNVAYAGAWKRTNGTFVININYKPETGDRTQLQDAETLKALFENTNFGNTKTQECSIQTAGVVDGWYNVQVITQYIYEGI